jgi:hypothetical protein
VILLPEADDWVTHFINKLIGGNFIIIVLMYMYESGTHFPYKGL